MGDISMRHTLVEEKWDGAGRSQEDLMRTDDCIVLDENDNVIGYENKYQCHQFRPQIPRGLLHRAFSVFLFNSEGKLLLQQRAASKITFPDVWTNTCCSHPLRGSETDTPADLQNGTVPGVKMAAIRKLKHELGIESDQVQVQNFKFLTRLHYWAADTVTHGPKSPWGEHEIDYVLFIKADVKCSPNPEEVQATKYVTLPELRKMMSQSQLLWSPWFRVIADQFLEKWWKDLDTTINTDAHQDVKTIHRFDPPEKHFGGAGSAGAYLSMRKSFAGISAASEPAKVAKQGAYGKVKIHSESKFSQLLRFSEVVSTVRCLVKPPLKDSCDLDQNGELKYCNMMLGHVSRSFAAVIRQLPENLVKEVLVFYLVLRGLDTIEDDMEAFASNTEKILQLQNFHEWALENPYWSMTGVGKSHEADLLENFYKVSRTFQSLSPGSQAIIKDITKRMGDGMAEFVAKDLGEGTKTLAEYDRYCHFVAGLVGEGLSRLFSESGLESPQLEQELELADSMGKFLQKVNIIRDYLEDYVDGRAFWPQEIWKKYTPSKLDKLGIFSKAPNQDVSIHCLNDLVANALEHVPDCLAYLRMLRNDQVFQFCAVPQVMAIATLDKLYSNPDVFTGVVKIRKTLACKLILNSRNMEEVCSLFSEFASNILNRVDATDPSAQRVIASCEQILRLTEQPRKASKKSGVFSPMWSHVVAAGVGAAAVYVTMV